MYSESIGNKLRELRIEKKLTSNQLAAELYKMGLNISGSALGKYERNERQPDYSTLTILADYYNISLDWLFDRSSYKQLSDEIIKKIDSNDYNLIQISKLLIEKCIYMGILKNYDDLDENFVHKLTDFIDSFIISKDIFEQLVM